MRDKLNVTFTYPSTARVTGAPQMTSQLVSSSFFFFFSNAHWVLERSRPVHSLMLSSHLFFLSSSPFHYALQDCFGQT